MYGPPRGRLGWILGFVLVAAAVAIALFNTMAHQDTLIEKQPVATYDLDSQRLFMGGKVTPHHTQSYDNPIELSNDQSISPRRATAIFKAEMKSAILIAAPDTATDREVHSEIQPRLQRTDALTHYEQYRARLRQEDR